MYDTISHAFPQKKIHYSIEELLIDVDTRHEKYHSMKKTKTIFHITNLHVLNSSRLEKDNRFKRLYVVSKNYNFVNLLYKMSMLNKVKVLKYRLLKKGQHC